MSRITRARPPAGYFDLLGGPVFAFNQNYLNLTGRDVEVTILVGVVANPQQNGHAWLEVTPPPGKPGSGTWTAIDFCATRNNQAAGTGAGAVQSGGPNIAAGGKMCGVVPTGFFWRVRTAAIAGYTIPTFVTDNLNYVLGRYV